MTDDERELRGCLIDYIAYARDRIDEMLSEPDDLTDLWTEEELRAISTAADGFTDIYKIMRRQREDRRILASWLD